MHFSLDEEKGFSITEFLISFSIVAVILSVIIYNQASYSDGVALSNLADEISLTISQAQAYGVAVRELSPGSGEFSIAYGLVFSLLSSGSSADHIYFADRNNNKIYDGDWSCPTGGTSECLAKNALSRGNYINDICIVRSSGSDQCSIGRTDISFTRPKTEPTLKFFNQSGGAISLPDIIGAKILLRSPQGKTRSVTVYNTGQISVQ